MIACQALVLCVVACAWCAAAEPPFPWCFPVIPPNDPVSGTTQAAQLCAPAAHESLVRQLAQVRSERVLLELDASRDEAMPCGAIAGVGAAAMPTVQPGRRWQLPRTQSFS